MDPHAIAITAMLVFPAFALASALLAEHVTQALWKRGSRNK